MAVSISCSQARNLLVRFHFTQTDLPGVIERLGTVQYDPLNPVGRNPDLVFQARVPGYKVDDWQELAYTDRLIYDSWDKQACLVGVGDWPMRRLIREKYHPYHDRTVLKEDAEGAAMILAALDAQGPLSSLEFEDRSRYDDANSWYGLTRSKRLLRALWANGLIVTHHRKAGRHYYDRAERVIPAEHYQAQPLLDEDAYHCWIILRRHQAAGLLRPGAEAAIWSACGEKAQRVKAIQHLVESGELTPVQVGEDKVLYHLPTPLLKLLDQPPLPPRMIFLGPLDSFLWDRKAMLHLFNFDYVWEVYKPEPVRKWGYYVLPVFYKERFVGRFDSRLEKGTWTISRWWWEADVTLDDELLTAFSQAAQNFLDYLRADNICAEDGIDESVKRATMHV